ncbi:hypothetical protein AMJ85_10380, partial [candidate division BRC1 bacterium SM23_51]
KSLGQSFVGERLRGCYHRVRSWGGRGTQKVRKWPSIRTDEIGQIDAMESIRAALGWIVRSQDVRRTANDDGGSSAWFSVASRKWAPSYPETTGYIIVTLLEALDTLECEPDLRCEIEERAKRMARWLLTLQLPNGAFPGGQASGAGPCPNFFNTAQILSGLLAAGLRWNESAFLAAAERAADWMCSIQNADGTWERDIYDRSCRAYYAHAVWPLAAASRIETFRRAAQYRKAAQKFVDWVLSRQRDNGWVERSSLFTAEMRAEYSILHTIAYTIEGLLELGATLAEEKCCAAALLAAERLMRRFEIDGVLWAEYDERWRPFANYICVTGCAQMGRIWGRCYELTRDVRYLNAMLKMNDCLRAVQPRDRAPEEIRGGFPGSIPIYGKYQPNQWPNWPVKFALDSFLIELRLVEALRLSAVHLLAALAFREETAMSGRRPSS